MGPPPHQDDVTEHRTPRTRGPPRKPELWFLNTSLTVFIWWDVPAASFLFVAAIFFVVALILEIAVATSPAGAAALPTVTGVTVVLGLLTAYGVWAYRSEKEEILKAAAPRRIK